MKKNSEEIVDQLLQGLRDAEAPAGMELRILHALEDRARGVSPSKRRWNGTSAARRWYWPVALGAAAAIMLLLTFVLHRPAHDPASVTAQSQVPPAHSAAQPHALPSLVSVVSIVSEATPPPAKKPASRHASSLSADSAEERLCLRELRTPSHPEPPEPITAEEKILLRIAHTAAPEEIAMLNPEIRAHQQAISAAEFERFAQSSTNQNQQNR
jgi:hypothetical protein